MTKEEDFNDIKVGDEVVVTTRYNMYIDVVTKVSPKRFKVKETVYNKSNGFEHCRWSPNQCLHVTDELRIEVTRVQCLARMKYKLVNVCFRSFTYEQTKLLYDFMVEHNLLDDKI